MCTWCKDLKLPGVAISTQNTPSVRHYAFRLSADDWTYCEAIFDLKLYTLTAFFTHCQMISIHFRSSVYAYCRTLFDHLSQVKVNINVSISSLF